MKLDKEIRELLLKNDCVIVPDFGGFVANYKPAEIQEAFSILFPPSKAISFNQQLKQNDGLLPNYIAEKNNTTYSEACEAIKKCVTHYQQLLEEGKRVVFEQIGILYKDPSGKLLFIPNKEVNFLLDAYGLKSFYQPPVRKEEKEPSRRSDAGKVIPMPLSIANTQESKDTKSTTKVIEGNSANASKRRYLVAVILLPLIGLGVWLSYQNRLLEKGKNQFSRLFALESKIAPSPLYHPHVAEIQISSFSEEDPLEEKIHQLKDTQTLKLSFLPNHHDLKKVTIGPKANPIKPKVTANYKFHIIGGCFQYEENATGFVRKLEKLGYQASVVDLHKGLHRVAYNSYANRKEALLGLAAVRNRENPNAWLLSK